MRLLNDLLKVLSKRPAISALTVLVLVLLLSLMMKMTVSSEGFAQSKDEDKSKDADEKETEKEDKKDDGNKEKEDDDEDEEDMKTVKKTGKVSKSDKAKPHDPKESKNMSVKSTVADTDKSLSETMKDVDVAAQTQMLKDTKALMEHQKNLMEMIETTKPMLTQGMQMMNTFKTMFGKEQ